MWPGAVTVSAEHCTHALYIQPLDLHPGLAVCRHFADLTARGLTPNAAATLALKLHYGTGTPAS